MKDFRLPIVFSLVFLIVTTVVVFSIMSDEEYDLLSEIINEINDFYGKVPEGTEESTKKLLKDIVSDDEFLKVVQSNNTDSNKKDKLTKIYENKNIDTLDVNTKLYEFFEKKEFKERMIRLFISNPELIKQIRV